MTRLGMLLPLLALLGWPAAGASQEGDSAGPWLPSSGAISLSSGIVHDVGQFTRRIGTWWHPSPHWTLGATGQLWDGYRLVEPELRWLFTGRRKYSPYLAISGGLQERRGIAAAGAAGEVGLELYPLSEFSLYVTVGWRLLWREALFDDQHGRRLRAGFSWFVRQ